MIDRRLWHFSFLIAAGSLACSLTGTGSVEPTAAPTEPVATESVQPDPATEAPTSAPPTEAPTEAAAFVGATACDHLYLPLKVGATWEYAGSFRLVQTVTAVEGDAALATATLSSKAGDSLADTLTYVCTPEGIRRGDSVYGGSDTYTNVFKEGVEVPSAALLTPGYRWSYTLEEEAFGAVTEISRSSEVSGAQTVEIGGKSFDALLIDYDQGGRTGQQIWAKGVGVYSYGANSGLTLESFSPGTP